MFSISWAVFLSELTLYQTVERRLLYRLFSVFLATLDLKAFDVKALRAFRVLRPLKLVSGVPSTYP